MEVLPYLTQNKQRFLDELFEMLRIPSVSADPKFSDDVFEAAEYVKKKIQDAGADNVELIPIIRLVNRIDRCGLSKRRQ